MFQLKITVLSRTIVQKIQFPIFTHYSNDSIQKTHFPMECKAPVTSTIPGLSSTLAFLNKDRVLI